MPAAALQTGDTRPMSSASSMPPGPARRPSPWRGLATALAIGHFLLWGDAPISAAEAAGDASRLRQLSDIEVLAFHWTLDADDLQALAADLRDPRPVLADRATAVYAGIMTGMARQYVVSLEALARRRLPAAEVKALVAAARAASPDGAASGLTSLDLGPVAAAPPAGSDAVSIEVARWYIAVGRADLAAPLITAAAQGTDEPLAIRAAELGADLLTGQRRLGDAIQGYEYAQSLIARLHRDSSGYERKVDWHGEDDLLGLRIAAKLKEARRLADLDRYGPGYVAYREAEGLRVTAHDPVAALVKHRRLQVEQAGSIFAAAARAATVKCLTTLGACAANAPNLFTRLLAGAITMIFFTYAFVNMGMVSGIVPVVGVPLPFMSYGGTALLTLGLGSGILMSIQRHRKLVQS